MPSGIYKRTKENTLKSGLATKKRFSDPKKREEQRQKVLRWYKKHPPKTGKDNPRFGKYGKLCPNFKGGRITTSRGFVYIYQIRKSEKDKPTYISEHNLVTEKQLKRKLKKGEIIFHINKINSDNHPENLYLFKNRSEAMKMFYSGIKNFKSNII